MPYVTATPKGMLNGEVVTEFTDTTSTISVTYSYPIQQTGLYIENSGIADIFVSVGNYTNQVVKPNKKWKVDVVFISFSINSDVNSQEFIATSFQNEVKQNVPVTTPIGFTWENHPLTGKIFNDGYGNFSVHKFDVGDYEYVGSGKIYYVSPSGNNANGGTTRQAPLQSLRAALLKPDVDIILLEPALYPRKLVGGTAITAFGRSVTIKAPWGKATLSAHESYDDLTWTKTAGQTNVFETPVGTVQRVYDSSILDADGDYNKMTVRASIVDVNANPGSWFQTGGILYVHTPDSRPIDASIRVFLNISLFNVTYNRFATVYIENVDFEGGVNFVLRNTVGGTGSPKLYMKNGTLKYGYSTDGAIELKGVSEAFFQNVLTAKHEADGFNYHIQDGVISNVIEIDCVGRDNGTTGTSTNNGSSMHDGGKIIRINGSYYRNEGPNCIDVSPNTVSYNLGCVARQSKAILASSRADFKSSQGDATGQAKMWLDGCKAYGSHYSLQTADYSNLYIRNTIYETQNLGTTSSSVTLF